MIELSALGRGTIRRDGEELVAISSHKQKLALIVYLAVEARAPRDRLLTVFWPERDEERARHSLSQALYALRRELGEECIHVEGDSVVASSAAWWVDVRDLEEAARAERWADVIELYQGHFLEQFTLPAAPEFEKWQSETHARLARLARRAFREVVRRQQAAGDIGAALAAATRWSALEPLEDEAQHTLIALLARGGQRAAALEHYEAYRSRLAEELQVEPLDETKALVERIRAGEVPEFEPLVTPRRAEAVREPAAAYEAEPVEAAPPIPSRSLVDQLRERRIFHVAAVYLAAAWAALEFTDTLAERGMLPEWVFPILLVLLAAALPFTLIVAWAHEETPARPPGTVMRRLWPQWAEKVRGGQVAGVLSVLVVGLLAGWLLVEQMLPKIRGLDRSRVLVFPLETAPRASDAAGEDVATWIGYTLESTGRLKWIDGWYVLRAGIESLTQRTAAERARAEGARFYLRGRVSLREDSVVVRVELHDVEGDSVFARAEFGDLRDPDWTRRAGDGIAGQLLAVLTPGATPFELASSQETTPAVAEFLEGERAYRRARFREALAHYRAAVELDSTLALAALKGALALCWDVHCSGADELVGLALRRAAFLPPHRAHFAYGIGAYLDGQADSAVYRFRRAVAIDSTYWEAWARLGETYTHLLPSESPLDSLAEATLLIVRRRAPDEFHPVLYHLSESAIRKGELERAASLVRDYRDAGPDPQHLRFLQLMLECVSGPPELIDWRTEVLSNPNTVYLAAQSLATAGSQAGCARGAWTAILDHDSATDAWGVNRRFGSLVGLQSVLVAEGRHDDLVRLLDAQTEFQNLAGDFYLLDANAGAATEGQASEKVVELRESFKSPRMPSGRIWMLGLWEYRHGRVEALRALADSLAARAAREDDWLARVLGTALEARAVLAAADSASAIELLRGLVPAKRPGVGWRPWETLAAEQILLAKLLYARGDYAAAVRVAANLDAPARPPADLIYLPASLVLRIRAARELSDAELERRSRKRLRQLGRVDLLRALDSDR